MALSRAGAGRNSPVPADVFPNRFILHLAISIQTQAYILQLNYCLDLFQMYLVLIFLQFLIFMMYGNEDKFGFLFVLIFSVTSTYIQ